MARLYNGLYGRKKEEMTEVEMPRCFWILEQLEERAERELKKEKKEEVKQ